MIDDFDKPINWISFIPSLMPMIELLVQGEHRDTIRIRTSFCFKYSNAQWKSLGPSTQNQAAVRTGDGCEEIRQLETEVLLPTMGHARLG